MQETRENQADAQRQKLTREERKALRLADLLELSFEERLHLLNKVERRIEIALAIHERQKENGVPVTQEQLERVLASDKLTRECLIQIRIETETPRVDEGTQLPALFADVRCEVCRRKLELCPRNADGFPLVREQFGCGNMSKVELGHQTVFTATGRDTVCNL